MGNHASIYREEQANMRSSYLYRGFAVLLLISALQGCATTAQDVALGTSIGTGVLARTPTNELEQIYYLGSFDPRGQLPPTIYRVRVHGQASAFSNVNFASGWVPAGVIDSLSTSIRFDNNNNVSITNANDKAGLDLHRRLMQFGPEGFREAPADHRLVIVMGADPSNYFNGIETALGQISQFDVTQENNELKMALLQELVRLHDAELELSRLGNKIEKSEGELE